MERRATRTRTTLAVSLLALTLIAPWALGQDLTETRRLAEQGDADAQFNLGVMYANGEGVPQDEAEAVRWYRLSADQGNAFAQYDLGFRYAIGLGVPQDEAEAVRWYRLSADQGNADAQYNLGFSYSIGLGIPQDEAEAVRWYRLSADQGNASAQYSLGVKVRQPFRGTPPRCTTSGAGTPSAGASRRTRPSPCAGIERISQTQGNASAHGQDSGSSTLNRRGCPQGRG